MKKNIIYLTTLAFFLVFLIQLINILSNSSAYQNLLEEKTNIYVYGSSAPRGRIMDKNGKVLVDNKSIKTIYYHKLKNIKVKEELEIAKTLANITNPPKPSRNDLINYYLALNDSGKNLITASEYEDYEKRKLTNKDLNDLKISRITDEMLNYNEFELKEASIFALMNKGYNYSKKEIIKNISEEEYAKIIEANIPGITGEITWERTYNYGDTLKNIFGSIGLIPKENKDKYLNNGYELTDIVGLSYLESQYEDYLKGTKAKYKVNSDNSLTKIEEEKKGSDLYLSIDIDIQLKLEQIIKDKILLGQKSPNTEYYKDSYAIISEPKTGSILAISGERLNEDNTFSDITINNINKSFTIGSSVKGATIGVGYKYDLITPGAFITDSCVKLYNVPQKCSFKRLGKVNDLTALANSSNYYQYQIAIKLTGNTYTPNMKLNATKEHFDIYRNMLSSFGLGVKTEIDLPGETTGIKGSIISDDLLLNLAIGQYDTYTPVQVLQYINSIATGNRIKLSLLNEVRDEEKIIMKNEPKVLNKVDLDDKDLKRIKEGLKLVLSEGTGKFYVPQGLEFAGKTGTSESFLDINNDNIVDVATISSTFAGFYPASDPKYSIVVITPNVSHKEGKSDTMYFGASKITKEIVTFLKDNY